MIDYLLDMALSRNALSALLDERLRPGADLDDIDRRIQERFLERWCVVFTDMSGFSRRAARDGIIPFLALMHQMNRIVAPIVDRHSGLLLKVIADSHMILFRDARKGLEACIEIQQALRRHNDAITEADRIYLGCGIGFGDVLKLGDDDVYGVEVNFAAKLGEDLAGPYQIFLTPGARKAIGRAAGVKIRQVPGGRLGGTKLPYFEAVFKAASDTEARRARRGRVRFR